MLQRFIIRIFIFALIISAFAALLFIFVIPQFYLAVFPFLVVFYLVITISIHTILTKAGKQKISRFSTFYMGSISVKLFIYIIFMTIYVLLNKSTAIPFLITFFILYILFTTFETYSLLKDLKNQTPPITN